MALETDTDRLLFFDSDDFGIVAQVGGAEVSGIFEEGYAEASGVAGSTPALTCRSVDVSSVVEGDAVVIDGRSFQVRSPVRSYGAIAILDLREV